MTPCCQKVIDTYTMLFNPPRDGATLYCPGCGARLIYTAGAWTRKDL